MSTPTDRVADRFSAVRTKSRGWLIAVWVAIALAAAYSYAVRTSTGTSDLPQAPRQGPAGPVPPALASFYSQRLTWGGCADFTRTDRDRDALNRPDVHCAWLTVPLDYDHPQGDTIRIPLSWMSARDQSKRIGVLVSNPGGPGGAGLADSVIDADNAGGELVDRFDFAGFDPRGVGMSDPAVHCLTGPELDAARANPPADFVAEGKSFADSCQRNTPKALLAHVGTRNVARDMDIMRSALGETQLNFVGFSYGTYLGYAYAALFPYNLRAQILDGAVDPEQEAKDTANADDPIPIADETGKWDDDFVDVFPEFMKWCVQHDCALGPDTTTARSELDKVLEPLKQKPTRSGDGRRLSYEDARTAVIHAMYGRSDWDTLNNGLTDLKKGGPGADLIKLADAYYQRSPDGKYSNIQDALAAIRCADWGCPSWPRPDGPQPKVEASALSPALVISATHDVATPIGNARNLAKEIGGRLLTVDASQHTSFLQDNKCVDAAGTAYLVSLTLPAENTTC